MTWEFQHSSRGRKGNPEVLLWCYLHTASIPLLACCGYAHAHTQAHNRVLVCANHEIERATNNQLHFHDEYVCSREECILTCPGRSGSCSGNMQQSNLVQLKTHYRKMYMKASQEAEKHVHGLRDRSHGRDWSEQRRWERVIFRAGKLQSLKRWLTLQKDSGAIRCHLLQEISIGSLVWEESSVWIIGIHLVLLLVMAQLSTQDSLQGHD